VATRAARSNATKRAQQGLRRRRPEADDGTRLERLQLGFEPGTAAASSRDDGFLCSRRLPASISRAGRERLAATLL
jgi:hypothetical protein